MPLTDQELRDADRYFSRRFRGPDDNSGHEKTGSPLNQKARPLRHRHQAVALVLPVESHAQLEPSVNAPHPSSRAERKRRTEYKNLVAAALEKLPVDDRPQPGEEFIDCYMRLGRKQGGEAYLIMIQFNELLRCQLDQNADLKAEFDQLIGPARITMARKKSDHVFEKQYL